jgi:DNA polymerase III subunit delta'
MSNDNWKDICGQDSVKVLLDSLLNSDKIPHAFLFKGNDGVGKEYTAIRFAQFLNLRQSVNAPNQHIIQFIQNLNEPYVKYIFPLPRGKNETEASGPYEKLSQEENEIIKEELKEKISNPYYRMKIPKANQIKISSIRDIRRFLAMDYSDVKFRFVIISSAHLMNEEAQNALLKNLEEPPEGIIFILTTPFPELLRETIISRCWIINFHPLKTLEIEKILVSEFKIEREMAESVAPFSNGSVTNALNLLQYDMAVLKEKTILVLRYSFGRRYHSALDEINTFISEQGSDALKMLLLMIISWLNDLQKYRSGLTDYFFDGYVETLQKFNLRFSDIKLNKIVFKLDKFSSLIKSNINLNTLALNIVTELSLLTQR